MENFACENRESIKQFENQFTEDSEKHVTGTQPGEFDNPGQCFYIIGIITQITFIVQIGTKSLKTGLNYSIIFIQRKTKLGYNNCTYDRIGEVYSKRNGQLIYSQKLQIL